MNVHELLDDLAQRGITLVAEGAVLRYRAPRGALTTDLCSEVSARKAELLAALGTSGLKAFTREIIGAPIPADDLPRQQLAAWALDHGCPELPIRPGTRIIGTSEAWSASSALGPLGRSRMRFAQLSVGTKADEACGRGLRTIARRRHAGAHTRQHRPVGSSCQPCAPRGRGRAIAPRSANVAVQRQAHQ
jgi:hypothetical protein